MSVIRPFFCKEILAPQILPKFYRLLNSKRYFCAISKAISSHSLEQRFIRQNKFTRGLSITEPRYSYDDKHDYPDLPSRESIIFDRDFIEMNVEDYESLYKNDETGEIKSQIETALRDYIYFKYNSLGRVPSHISVQDMSRLLDEAKTVNMREKFILFLFKREMAQRSRERARQLKKIAKQEAMEERNKKYEMLGGDRTGLFGHDGKLAYGLWHNTLLPRVSPTKMKCGLSGSRLRVASLFGQKIVFDFGFEAYMSPHLNRNSLDQIQECYGLNRYKYEEPFDLWFCNLKPGSFSETLLKNKIMTNLYENSMITVKSDCFTNHFDKSRLVYLSPDSPKKLVNFSEDDVYIIGVFNDKGTKKKLTHAKAESLGIPAYSLPLNDHIAWNVGTKSLCMNHVMAILHEVRKNGGDWRSAMVRALPSRKIKPLEMLIEEEKFRQDKLRLAQVRRKFSVRNHQNLV